MTLLGWAVRTMGVDMNAEMMLGTMFSSPERGAWVIGFGVHMLLSVLFALIYAWAFENVTHRAGLAVGLGFAVIHIVLAGIVMAMIPMVHPMIPERMMAPGAFMSGMGAMGVGLFVLEHLLYGGIVGASYGPVRRPAGAGHTAASVNAR